MNLSLSPKLYPNPYSFSLHFGGDLTAAQKKEFKGCSKEDTNSKLSDQKKVEEFNKSHNFIISKHRANLLEQTPSDRVFHENNKEKKELKEKFELLWRKNKLEPISFFKKELPELQSEISDVTLLSWKLKLSVGEYLGLTERLRTLYNLQELIRILKLILLGAWIRTF